MALIKCPECEKSISDKAEICIHCGYPIKTSKIQDTEKGESSSKINNDNNSLPNNDNIFLEEENILISKNKIKIHSRTYNPRQVESVKILTENNVEYKALHFHISSSKVMFWGFFILTLAFAAIFIFDNSQRTVSGTIFLVGIVILIFIRFYLISLKKKKVHEHIYTVVLSMSSGKEDALMTHDNEVVQKVMKAFENLIAFNT